MWAKTVKLFDFPIVLFPLIFGQMENNQYLILNYENALSIFNLHREQLIENFGNVWIKKVVW